MPYGVGVGKVDAALQAIVTIQIAASSNASNLPHLGAIEVNFSRFSLFGLVEVVAVLSFSLGIFKYPLSAG
jgi:hypothetical protein